MQKSSDLCQIDNFLGDNWLNFFLSFLFILIIEIMLTRRVAYVGNEICNESLGAEKV